MKQFAPRYAALGVVITGLGVALYLAAQPRLRAVQTKNCEINLKQIGNAMMQYSRDYDEKFPIATRWADDLKPYVASTQNAKTHGIAHLFHCPTTGSFFSYNRQLQTATIEQIKSLTRVPLAIEVAAGQVKTNLNGTGELWPTMPIHETAGAHGNHVLFVDGHVELTTNKPKFRSFPPTPTPTPRAKAKSKGKL